jgi:protection-of-telomeres protein 1
MLTAQSLRHRHHDLQRPQLIDELREKLFILWGNVKELKDEGKLGPADVTNRPFECCIMEYGVEQDDNWIRMHRMFGTTVR